MLSYYVIPFIFIMLLLISIILDSSMFVPRMCVFLFFPSICRFASKLWGLSGLKLLVLPSRRATDEELGLVHTKAQIAGLKRAASVAAAMKQVIWLPAKGSVETWKTDLAFLCVFAGHLAVLILENLKTDLTLKTLDVLMRRRFWYGFLPGKVFKGGSTPTTWQKARYIFCPQFVGRCQMFSRRSEFTVWRLKPKIRIQNSRNLSSTSGFRNSVTSLVRFLHPFWNCGIPPPFVLKIDSVPLKSFCEGIFMGLKIACPVCLGGLLQLVDQSVATSQQGIALCRPPGHHAGPSSSTGFCLVNNVAVAARYAIRKHPDSRK